MGPTENGSDLQMMDEAASAEPMWLKFLWCHPWGIPFPPYDLSDLAISLKVTRSSFTREGSVLNTASAINLSPTCSVPLVQCSTANFIHVPVMEVSNRLNG